MTKLGLEKEKSCDGKHRYETLEAASKAAVGLCLKGKKRIEMDSYHCIFCLKYHTGHAAMVKTIKNPSKLKREVFRIEPRKYSGAHPNLKTGYCMIKKNYLG